MNEGVIAGPSVPGLCCFPKTRRKYNCSTRICRAGTTPLIASVSVHEIAAKDEQTLGGEWISFRVMMAGFQIP